MKNLFLILLLVLVSTAIQVEGFAAGFYEDNQQIQAKLVSESEYDIECKFGEPVTNLIETVESQKEKKIMEIPTAYYVLMAVILFVLVTS